MPRYINDYHIINCIYVEELMIYVQNLLFNIIFYLS